MMKMNKMIALLSLLLGLLIITTGCGKKQETVKEVTYPQKTIKLVNFASQGVGADLMTRKIAEIIKSDRGWNFEVSNEAGNLGSDALKKVWEAPHDGYTIGGVSENVFGFAPLGLVKQTTKDWVYFVASYEPSVLAVAKDSPYMTVEDIVKAAKENPGKIRIGNGGVGKSFHLKAKALEKVAGVEFSHPTFKTSGLAKALLDNEADVVSAPITAIISDAMEGKIRILATTDLGAEKFDAPIGIIDSVTKAYPEYVKYLPLDGVIMYVMPADVNKDVINTFGKAPRVSNG